MASITGTSAKVRFFALLSNEPGNLRKLYTCADGIYQYKILNHGVSKPEARLVGILADNPFTFAAGRAVRKRPHMDMGAKIEGAPAIGFVQCFFGAPIDVDVLDPGSGLKARQFIRPHKLVRQVADAGHDVLNIDPYGKRGRDGSGQPTRMADGYLIGRPFQMRFAELVFIKNSTQAAPRHIMYKLAGGQPFHPAPAPDLRQLLLLGIRQGQAVAKPGLRFLDPPDAQLALRLNMLV